MTLARTEIRFATPGDVQALPDIERRAALLFKTHPEDLGIPESLYQQSNSIDTFAMAQKAGRLWVASRDGFEVIGFALVLDIAGYAHLDELDVLPQHGGQGIGSALLAAVCAWAKTEGYAAVTLRTFRDVPWNAPFYRRRGFRVVDGATLSAEHAALEVSEQQRGLRSELRVTMVYDTTV